MSCATIGLLIELSRREDYELLPNLWNQLAGWESDLHCVRSHARGGGSRRGARPDSGHNPRSYSGNDTRRAPLPAAGAGLTPNVAGALAYLVGAITGILFLVIDPFKNDRFVRFHAFQSIFFNLAWIGFWIVWSILGLMLSAVSHGLFFIIQLPINLLISIGGFCLWIYLMYTAYQGKTFQYR